MKKLLSGLVLALIPLVMSGCGSGDFSNSSGTTISGVGSKGPINGANIAIFSVTTSAHIGKQLATGTTTASGAFSANLGSYTGAIFATMSGSSASYTDEATNTTKTLGTTKLHAAAVITAPGPFNLAITPFTELAYQQTVGSPTQANINAANNLISNLFLQGTNIISTLPANIQSTAPVVTNPGTINYSLALARFSQVLATANATTPGSLNVTGAITLLNSEISGTTLTSPEWTASSVALAANTTFTGNFQSGLLNAPVSIAFSSPTYAAIVNQSIPITVNVTNFNGTAVSGAAVSFTATNGTFGAPTTNADGSITANLTPTAVGTVTVNASATAPTAPGVTVSTKTAAVVTVVQNPEDPATVTLAASPSTPVQTGQTVTLSATVGVAGGGPNNVTPGSAPNPAATVTFTITSGTGTLSAATATTNASGVATVNVTSTTANTVTVTASAGTSPSVVTSSPVTVPFTPDPLAPATVTVGASPTSIPANGAATSTITANVKNYAGTALSGVPVAFTTTGGSLSASSAITNSSGVATVTLTSSSTTGSATVTASATADNVTKTGTTSVAFTTVASGTATVIVATSGTLPSGTTIGGIGATLTYPTTIGLTATSEAVSGVASSALPEFNATTSGEVIMGVISTSGFSTGQFATITFSYSGSVPVASDFAIASGASVIDTNGKTISGISVIIQSVNP